MTPEECVEIGGHCWKENDYALMLGDGTNVYVRQCKHCDQKQHGRDQPSIRWEDA